jgi:hypothetical protein
VRAAPATAAAAIATTLTTILCADNLSRALLTVLEGCFEKAHSKQKCDADDQDAGGGDYQYFRAIKTSENAQHRAPSTRPQTPPHRSLISVLRALI